MRARTTLLAGLLLLVLNPSNAQQAANPPVFSLLQWRCIGPFRGGRTVGATGVPQQPGTFYIGVNNDGVWKTTDYGRIWTPIFDDQPSGFIGDVAMAPSDLNVLKVSGGPTSRWATAYTAPPTAENVEKSQVHRREHRRHPGDH